MNDLIKTKMAGSYEMLHERSLIVILGLLSLMVMSPSNALGRESKVNWQFTDIEGKLHKPFEDPSTTGIVFVFISTDCPIANSYQPLLRRLHKKYNEKGVRLFQIHPHRETSVETARKHATEFGIESPILVDVEQSLSRRVGATVTPEAFVFLRDESLPVYQGRIDDLYAGYGKKRKVATSNDLADILEQLVAGQPLTPKTTRAVGCFISFENKPKHNAVEKEKRVGYEILQVKSFNEIIAWASKDITREQFAALKLPLGWLKNQPREVEMDRAKFLNSPGCERGTYVKAQHFGHEWLHVATVKGRVKLDPKRLLVGSKVMKDHVVSFYGGRTLTLLISPEGAVFPRITRDANRSREDPTLPEDWRLIEHDLDEPVEFELTNEAMVIRTDNQDSFQGPVSFSF